MFNSSNKVPENIGLLIVSNWNDAHDNYTKIYKSFDHERDVINAHTDWNAWRHKRPQDSQSEAAYILSVEVKKYYAEGWIKRQENEAARKAGFAEMQRQGLEESARAEARVQWANATLPPFWTVGVQLGALAARVAATRPSDIWMTVPSMLNAPKVKRPPNEMVAPIADDAALLAVLNALDGDVSEIAKAIKAIRAAITARAKAA